MVMLRSNSFLNLTVYKKTLRPRSHATLKDRPQSRGLPAQRDHKQKNDFEMNTCTPEIAFTTVLLPCATCPIVPETSCWYMQDANF